MKEKPKKGESIFEKNGNLLFSGMLLKEYWINIETGEIEEIQ